ncbi:MAG: hypothetical protein ACYC7E_09835 [Armatimonadota bacterium]
MTLDIHNRRQLKKTVGIAALAGVVAAGVVIVLYLRPGWRRQAASVGRYLLQLAESTILKHGER